MCEVEYLVGVDIGFWLLRWSDFFEGVVVLWLECGVLCGVDCVDCVVFFFELNLEGLFWCFVVVGLVVVVVFVVYVLYDDGGMCGILFDDFVG